MFEGSAGTICLNLQAKVFKPPSRAQLSIAIQECAKLGDCSNTPVGNIAEWDVSAVTDMSYLFRDTSQFNQDLSSWNVSQVTNMEGMFYENA